jgi:hypothetical protein
MVEPEAARFNTCGQCSDRDESPTRGRPAVCSDPQLQSRYFPATSDGPTSGETCDLRFIRYLRSLAQDELASQFAKAGCIVSDEEGRPTHITVESYRSLSAGGELWAHREALVGLAEACFEVEGVSAELR